MKSITLGRINWKKRKLNGDHFYCMVFFLINIHFIFLPVILNILGINFPNSYTYFHRAVDIEIGESDSKTFVYAKFARFLIFGEITGILESDFAKTNIFKLDILEPVISNPK